MTLLVVDDEKKICELIRKYAVYEGYDVDEACNGMEAIEKCRCGQYDLVILDVMMPELDGFSACREIRKFCSVPIIMLSARGEEYDRIHGFELGVDDYVVKPFSPRELMMRIAAILKRVTGGASDATMKIQSRFAIGGRTNTFLRGEICTMNPAPLSSISISTRSPANGSASPRRRRPLALHSTTRSSAAT